MPTYRKHTPDPEPIQHSYEFTRDEVIRALEAWCAAQGLTLPPGNREIGGIERRYGGDYEDRSQVTLYIVEGVGR